MVQPLVGLMMVKRIPINLSCRLQRRNFGFNVQIDNLRAFLGQVKLVLMASIQSNLVKFYGINRFKLRNSSPASPNTIL